VVPPPLGLRGHPGEGPQKKNPQPRTPRAMLDASTTAIPLGGGGLGPLTRVGTRTPWPDCAFRHNRKHSESWEFYVMILPTGLREFSKCNCGQHLSALSGARFRCLPLRRESTEKAAISGASQAAPPQAFGFRHNSCCKSLKSNTLRQIIPLACIPSQGITHFAEIMSHFGASCA
jgi:hypothetical protein